MKDVISTRISEKRPRSAWNRVLADWASPIHMVPKGFDDWRICDDYRGLNSITIPDRYPVSHLHYFLVHLRGKRIFSKLYLETAYHQIPVAPEDIPKTTVITPFGLFEFLVMTFGLRNAGQTFQRYIHRALEIWSLFLLTLMMCLLHLRVKRSMRNIFDWSFNVLRILVFGLISQNVSLGRRNWSFLVM